ncbi:hypothetical protein F4779DRAFT_547899 [Xylariaceae sp. FL0662B]|nr:hypothetical protein F4779DRAFT_547899 [Xylariaceae sp. FL0662B]
MDPSRLSSSYVEDIAEDGDYLVTAVSSKKALQNKVKRSPRSNHGVSYHHHSSKDLYPPAYGTPRNTYHETTPRVGRSGAFRNMGGCSHCNLRKVRCDGKLPSCTSCEKSRVACVRFDPIERKEIPSSTYYLKTRIKQLEDILLNNKIEFPPAEDLLQVVEEEPRYDSKVVRMDRNPRRRPLYYSSESTDDEMAGIKIKGTSARLPKELRARKAKPTSTRKNDLNDKIDTSSNTHQYVDVGVQVDVQDDCSDKNLRILSTESLASHQESADNFDAAHIADHHNADTVPDFQMTKHQSAHQIRQVGLVQVRVELLTLSERYKTSQDESNYQTESDLQEFGGQEQINRRTRGSPNIQQMGTNASLQDDTGGSSSHSSSERASSSGPNNKRRKDNGDDEHDRNNKARRISPGPVEKQRPLRLACPYQAHEKFQSCLKRGRANPRGGCAGINRLKQHLNRRHMLSFRCQRCWRSFDSRSNARDHEARQPPCDARERSWDERFMRNEQESEIEIACRSKSEEDAWWSLFRLLIPDMQYRDMASLSAEYSPYYIYYEAALMVPAMTFSTLPCRQIQLNETGTDSSVLNLLDSTAPFSTTSNFVEPSTTSTMPSPAPLTQDFSMPLLEVSSTPMYDIDSSFLCAPTVNHIAPVSSNTTSASTSGILRAPLSSTTTPTSPSSMSSRSTFEQLHTQRNFERLRTRNQKAQRDNAELREANRESRESLDHADIILEDILNAEELPSHLYEKLSEVSETLQRIKDKMR